LRVNTRVHLLLVLSLDVVLLATGALIYYQNYGNTVCPPYCAPFNPPSASAAKGVILGSILLLTGAGLLLVWVALYNLSEYRARKTNSPPPYPFPTE
jgi:hypothetical protein